MPIHRPRPLGRKFSPARAVVLGLAVVPTPFLASADEARTGEGERIYRARCASCHGKAGEGSEDYKKPLAGDRSVKGLARLIAKTMPEDDPGTCVGEDAEKVAAFIHGAFYSRIARARNAPARVELQRLTVRQYRDAVADLIGSFRPPAPRSERRGLRGEYYRSRRLGQADDRVLDRVDPEVRFDFGEAGPEPHTFDANKFSIRWEGSVVAPESGEYQFIIRTEHAARLWLNDPKMPLIDAWVKSGDDTEHRATLSLLGGRAYPLKLEFSKAKQGVDDEKKRKGNPRPVKASIALEWSPPHRTLEIIPSRDLVPERSPELFVLAAAFPPDDRSLGYERGTSVSKAWDQATTEAAIEVAGYVASHLRDLAGVADDAPDREARLREFCLRFVERAFRRPLDDEGRHRHIDRQFSGSADPNAAVKRVVLLALKSPRFLYREIDGAPDAFDVATRLAFGLWDSLPDPALLEAAASGRLSTSEQVARQAERMLSDPRTRSKVREFFFQWLKVEAVPDLAKDGARFPGFDAMIASDLRTSLDLTLEDATWGESSDFRRLLLGDTFFLNGRLAKFYGADLPEDAPFQKVALQPRERAGILSHPYLMATFAYRATSSPIHRGVFLARNVLGRTLRPPPEAVVPLAPDLHAGLSTRERVSLQTRPGSCMTCHAIINPLGFGLEQFDAVGRLRVEESGKPIDATGAYETPSGETLTYSGARELATVLAGSEETHSAFVERLFHHLVKQPVLAYGPQMHGDLTRSFVENGYDIRKLMVEIVAKTALSRQGTTDAKVIP